MNGRGRRGVAGLELLATWHRTPKREFLKRAAGSGGTGAGKNGGAGRSAGTGAGSLVAGCVVRARA